MLIGKIFNIKYFILGLLIGLILTLLYPIKKKQIIIYPTSANNKKVQYIDDANNCFEAEVKDTSCPKNPTNVKIIPIQ